MGIKIYEFRYENGEKDWVSGRTVIEAIKTLLVCSGMDFPELDSVDDVVEVPEKEWENYEITDTDEEGIPLMTFREWMFEGYSCSEIIASTCY